MFSLGAWRTISNKHQSRRSRSALTQISNLNSSEEPLGVYVDLYSWGLGCDEAALEVHTPWMRNKTSPFS
jgi:hypothetical protein